MTSFTDCIKRGFLASLVLTVIISGVVIFRYTEFNIVLQRKILPFSLVERVTPLPADSPERIASTGDITVSNVTGTIDNVFRSQGVPSTAFKRPTTVSSAYNINVSNEYQTNVINISTATTTKPLAICPQVPPNIKLPVHINLANITLQQIQTQYSASTPWGRYKPRECIPRGRLAVIIPYRDRETHMCILLHNLIPFLNKQQADFTIFIIEQTSSGIFNRGLLINAGVKAALRQDNFTCIIIHDVDLIPETSDNYYRCLDSPVHLSTANGKYGYKMPYTTYMGGVIAIRPKQFLETNGFSNWYFGWGGEDDDFGIRLKAVGTFLRRNHPRKGRYYAIKHDRDKMNPENVRKGRLFRGAGRRMKTEGFSTLHANQTVTPNNTFTLVRVDIHKHYYDRTIKYR